MKIYNHNNSDLTIVIDGMGITTVPKGGLSATIRVRAMPINKLKLLLSKYLVKFDSVAEKTYMLYNRVHFKEYKGEAIKPSTATLKALKDTQKEATPIQTTPEPLEARNDPITSQERATEQTVKTQPDTPIVETPFYVEIIDLDD